MVIKPGVDGVRKYTYDIIYKNGVMTDRVLAGTSVHEKPVNEIVAYGTSTSIPPSSSFTVSTTSQILTLEDGTQIPLRELCRRRRDRLYHGERGL